MILIDLSGKTFSRWTVLSAFKRVNRRVHWKCRCECGITKFVDSSSLRKGLSQSCGCLSVEIAKSKGLVHGHSGNQVDGSKESREYSIWCGIKKRCYNPNAQRWERYGGRGIKMCNDWKMNFESFLRDMGKCPEGMSIHRINNDGDYEPSNCVWSDNFEQANNRSNNVYMTVDDERLTVAQAARKLGINYSRAYKMAKILTKP